MRRWICLLTAWALLVAALPVSHAEEADPTMAEVVILLDQSKSMLEQQYPDQPTTCSELAMQWAQTLCMMLVGAPVKVRFMAFDESAWLAHEEDIDVFTIDPTSMENILTRVEHDVKFNGDYTNHYQAILDASGAPESSIGRSYVMISDGKLTSTGDVKAAESAFKDHCIELAKQNKIYLLGLGTKLGMFQDLDSTANITVMQNEDTDLDKLLHLLLAEVGYALYPGESKQSASEYFHFQINQRYEKTLVSITGANSSAATQLSEKDKKNIKLLVGNSMEEAKEVEIHPIQSGGSMFVYLSTPKQANYFMKLPPGTWSCRVNHIKAIALDGVSVTLYDDDVEVPKNGEVYMVSKDTSTLSLHIRALPQQGESVAGITVTYTLEPSGGTPVTKEVGAANCADNGEWIQPLSLVPNTEYTCQVKLAISGKEGSSTIQISTVWCPEVGIPGTVNEVIPLDSNQNLAELIPSGAKEITYRWGDTLLHAGEQIGNISVDEDSAVSFSQTGIYQLDILADGVKVAEVSYTIEKSPEPPWWQRALSWLFSLFRLDHT